VRFAKNMSERSPFEFDNLRYEEISFEKFCENFRLMLVDMRSNEGYFLDTFLNYFEFKLNGDNLSLTNIQVENIFEIVKRYENLVRSNFTDGLSYELILRDRMIDAYSEVEVINGIKTPWFWVGVFNQDLNKTRKELLACKNPEDNSIHFWKLSEAQDGSPANIPLEFRSVADKLRGVKETLS
jgi:hypothetical protein